jgi:hypothetical protein
MFCCWNGDRELELGSEFGLNEPVANAVWGCCCRNGLYPGELAVVDMDVGGAEYARGCNPCDWGSDCGVGVVPKDEGMTLYAVCAVCA